MGLVELVFLNLIFCYPLKEISPSNSFNDVLKKSLDKLKSKLTINFGKKITD